MSFEKEGRSDQKLMGCRGTPSGLFGTDGPAGARNGPKELRRQSERRVQQGNEERNKRSFQSGNSQAGIRPNSPTDCPLIPFLASFQVPSARGPDAERLPPPSLSICRAVASTQAVRGTSAACRAIPANLWTLQMSSRESDGGRRPSG